MATLRNYFYSKHKDRMKVKLILLLTLALTVTGMTQKSNPQTEMPLPSDTTQVGRITGKPEPMDPQLELPDVLILGEDRYHRLVKNKKNLTPDTPEIVQQESSYAPLTFWSNRESDKPHVGPDSAAATRTWAGLKGGTFFSVEGDVGHWRAIPKGDVLAAAWIDRSEGQFDNTKYTRGGINGKIDYDLNEQATVIAKVAYDHHAYGLYNTGFFHENGHRSGGGGLVSADLHYAVNKISAGSIGLEFGGLSLLSDTTGVEADHSGDFYYKLRFNCTTQYRKTQFFARGNFSRETFEVTSDSSAQKNSMSTLGVEILQPLSPLFSAALGVDYQGFKSDSTASLSRIAPFGRINFVPNDKVGASLQFSTGLRYNTFEEFWRQNPYVSHRVLLQPSQEKFGIKFDIDLQASKSVKLHAGFHRQWMEKLPYWQADTLNGFTSLPFLSDVEITEVEVGAVAELGKNARLYVSFIDYADDISEQATMGTGRLNQIPYRPSFRLPVRASFRLPAQINLMMTADLIGERRKNLVGNAALPVHVLIHLDLNKQFSEKITAIVTVRNLLNTRYSVWENFPEMGFVISAGARLRF